MESQVGAEEPRLVGSSPGIQRVRERLEALAPLDRPVLLRGEHGTGLRTAARLLFRLSKAGGCFARVRPDGPRPEALPHGSLLHVEGLEHFAPAERAHYAAALTHGAYGPTRARIVVSMRSAVALTRAPRCAPTQPLLEVVFPTLRERPEDVPRIARHLVERFGRELGRPGLRLSDAAMRRLRAQAWPGNVGELAAVIERLVAFTPRGTIERDEVDAVLSELRFSVDGLRERARAREREELVEALGRAEGNVSRTASILGRSRAAVYRLVEKHGVPLRRDP
ncbi:MAG: helix-turn-helix domain-containing protein [Myxococcota bacterium]|nr:helix-turn-helix domain-containing protein [Myxococcota bacterium]